MEIITYVVELRRVLDSCMKVVPNNPTHPVLGFVKIEAKKVDGSSRLEISATDLSTSFKGIASASFEEEISFLFPPKPLIKMLRSIKDTDTVSFEFQGDIPCQVKVKAGRKKMVIGCAACDDYPDDIRVEKTQSVKIPTDDFLKGLKTVSPSVSKENFQPLFTGINVDMGDTSNLRFIATDSRTLSIIDIMPEQPLSISEDFKKEAITIPDLSPLLRLLPDCDLCIWYDGKQIQIEGELGSVIKTRAFSGSFPDVFKFIPSFQKIKLDINRKNFLEKIKGLSVFPDNDVLVIKVQGFELQLEMNSNQDGGKVSDVFEIESRVEDAMTIGVRLSYLVRILDSFEDTEVSFRLDGSLSPIVVKTDNQIGMVMPTDLNPSH